MGASPTVVTPLSISVTRAVVADRMSPESKSLPHLAHWGAFRVDVANGRLVDVHAHDDGPAPNRLSENLLDGVQHPSRVSRPSIRRGWLENGPGPDARQGSDDFVEVDWADAIDLVAGELQRVRDDHGNSSIFGGSYGWASAGRFHHAQSQIHRFLNTIGGYTRSVNTYSDGAGEVILPRIVGSTGHHELTERGTSWRAILDHTDLVVCFGGMRTENSAVSYSGVTRHELASALGSAADRGIRFELFSPMRTDLPAQFDVAWHPVVPGTDVAVMLALAHVIVSENLHDAEFLDRYCVGADRLIAYVLGATDGVPKTPAWASELSSIPADMIRDLARRMTAARTFVSVSFSLQRSEHGEQPVWMGLALAALIGQLGLPGGGFGHGYASVAKVGAPSFRHPLPTLPQGTNPVSSFIPVAQITQLLENPGGTLDYDGQVLELPDIRLVYWCGGNPFHHHQDLNRLRRALQSVDTLVVHEPYWTATARHADIVLPATVTLERDDIGASHSDGYLIAMPAALAAWGDARDDYDIFTDIARRLGSHDEFTEHRSAREWLQHLYDQTRGRLGDRGVTVPDFETFWSDGEARLPPTEEGHTSFDRFRDDPEKFPLDTPSGVIELHSDTIEGFGYPDCPGHPAWMEPIEWLGGVRAARFPLQLMTNQPASRLHSQLDHGRHSQEAKIDGREPLRIHPTDARDRGIRTRDVVRIHNDRGACYAAAVVTDRIRPGVVNLSTGAWFAPVDPTRSKSPCANGNPNTLTADRGTSRLAQGCTGQHVLVEVESTDEPPPAQPHDPPRFVADPRPHRN